MEKVISLWLETGLGLQLGFNKQQQLVVNRFFQEHREYLRLLIIRGDRFCW